MMVTALMFQKELQHMQHHLDWSAASSRITQSSIVAVLALLPAETDYCVRAQFLLYTRQYSCSWHETSAAIFRKSVSTISIIIPHILYHDLARSRQLGKHVVVQVTLTNTAVVVSDTYEHRPTSLIVELHCVSAVR